MQSSHRSIPSRFLALLVLASFALVGPADAADPADCPESLPGAWTGMFDSGRVLELTLTIRELKRGGFEGEVRSAGAAETMPVWRDGEHLRFQAGQPPVAFDGVITKDGLEIGGFVQHGSTVTRLTLPVEAAAGRRSWTSTWSLLGLGAETTRLDLYIGDDGAGGLGGYFFFRDQRYPGLWGYGLDCRADRIQLSEKNLQLGFEGSLDPEQERLNMTVTGPAGSIPIGFERMPADTVPDMPDAPLGSPRGSGNAVYHEHAPETVGDGWPTVLPSEVGVDIRFITDMVAAITAEEMALTHSVLIARHGKLVVEEYFYGFDRYTWHDMRSASKTVTSTLVGLAVEEGKIEDVGAAALPFFPRYRSYANWDPRKARITIRDLLTMSSGLDANDSDPASVAAEGAYQSQRERPDWVKLALDAPMIANPGAQPLYGGANPLILGGILANSVGEPVEWFAHRRLFGPLGIEHYRFLLDPMGIVYMGGGLHLRPRDMLKYGQLYLDGGVWRGRRLLSEEWIAESWGQYGRLAPLDRNGHQYGYLWWHHRYRVGGRTITTVEARGNGGQYIFVVPSLDMVVVITSGNFRTGRTRQPEEILRRFIIPALAQASEEPRAP